ncbi:MAG: hypothetical protein JWN03_7931 [Nocardia sp.]|uniref:hypothetical protein n=1 Tax=Nocardia sp. TaxID=1821 RepID=UPI00260FA13D|nr:hypothetical protein [Nocardia sp.]MCU1647656.1 hypothetical protein [Nocardia sp.]
MPMQPIDHPLNLTMQAVLTYGSWGITVVLIALAIRMGLRERTPFYVLMVLAAMVAAFAEPLYDTALVLYFYSTDGMYTHFTAFGVPQPIWTHSGYAVLYASAAMFIAQAIHRGTLTSRGLYAFAGLELVMSSVFEMVGINGGAYAYWGPHVFRIFKYPLVIGVLEAAQVICFAVAAALLRKRATNPWQLLGLFVLFPCTFFMANFGAGAPTIIALHLDHVSETLIRLGAVASIVAAAVLIRAAASLLPLASGPVTPAEAPVSPKHADRR